MDHIFAKPNATSMGADWHSEPKVAPHKQEMKRCERWIEPDFSEGHRWVPRGEMVLQGLSHKLSKTGLPLTL